MNNMNREIDINYILVVSHMLITLFSQILSFLYLVKPSSISLFILKISCVRCHKLDGIQRLKSSVVWFLDTAASQDRIRRTRGARPSGLDADKERRLRSWAYGVPRKNPAVGRQEIAKVPLTETGQASIIVARPAFWYMKHEIIWFFNRLPGCLPRGRLFVGRS